MKFTTIFILIFLFIGTALAKDVYVKGHWKDTDHDGVKDTYIDPYYRTSPDSTIDNNYSTKGNVNPYTGEPGTVNPHENPYPQNNYDTTRSIYGR